MPAIQAILIDLDDTLFDDRSAMRAGLMAFLAAHHESLGTETSEASLARWRSVSAHHWQRFERGELSFQAQRQARVREFLRQNFSDAEAIAAFEPYRTAYESAWAPVPECRAFLARTRHLPKIILSNGERSEQVRKLQRYDIKSEFISMITPMDCGHWKPAPQMFMAGLKALGVAAANCLMIGDDPLRDIRPAEALGIQTYLIDPTDSQRSLMNALSWA